MADLLTVNFTLTKPSITFTLENSLAVDFTLSKPSMTFAFDSVEDVEGIEFAAMSMTFSFQGSN